MTPLWLCRIDSHSSSRQAAAISLSASLDKRSNCRSTWNKSESNKDAFSPFLSSRNSRHSLNCCFLMWLASGAYGPISWNLSWADHISKQASKTGHCLKILERFKSFLWIQVCNAFIQSFIENGPPLWTGTTASHIVPLEALGCKAFHVTGISHHILGSASCSL